MLNLTPPIPFAPFALADYSGACRRGANQLACQAPCFFIEKILSLNNRRPFEQGNEISPESKRMIRESEFNTHEDGDHAGAVNKAFSNWQNWIAQFKGTSTPGLHVEQPNAFFQNIDTRLKQSGIFIDRFFHRMSYGDLAVKYNTTRSGVAKMYVNAKKRIKKVVEAMDRAELAMSNGTPATDMPKTMRVFLLHTVFGLSNGEISRLLGMHHSLVNRYINTVRDKVLAGEYDLLTFTDQDRDAARARLEKERLDRAEYDRKCRTKK